MEKEGSVKHLYWRDLDMISSEGNSNVAPECSLSGLTAVKNTQNKQLIFSRFHIRYMTMAIGPKLARRPPFTPSNRCMINSNNTKQGKEKGSLGCLNCIASTSELKLNQAIYAFIHSFIHSIQLQFCTIKQKKNTRRWHYWFR
jgi:hypothetical protein